MEGKIPVNVDTDSLRGLLAYDAQDRAVWPAADLRGMLHCHLSAKLLRRLRCRSAAETKILSDLTATAHPAIITFDDLLHHHLPPLRLLVTVKEYAKLNFASPQSPLPHEIAALLYYGTIVTAMTRRNRTITTLSIDQLREALSHVLRQPWVDARTRSVFEAGLAHLRAGRYLWRQE